MKFEADRDIYENKTKRITLDVFYDRLNMCHSIDFVDRIENDFPTVTLADLVLQKLQIIEINDRDAKDIIVLFLEHKVGDTDEETIDGKYIAKLLSNDWGFYYTLTENIKKSNNLALKYPKDMLSAQELDLFQARTGKMLSMIEREPKSFKWKMREKIGTKTIWYNEVEEKERGTLAEYLINRQKERDMTKIFFCTDIHGSTRCWRKLVSALDFYRADVVVLGGDMTGKAVVPIVKQTNGTFTSAFLGRNWTLKDSKEVDEQKKLIVDAGMYVFECDPGDLEKLRGQTDEVDAIFREKVIERIREWLKIAEANLKPKNARIIVAPGNDDAEYVDVALRESDVILNAEGHVIDLDDHHEMITSGWSNPTPWHTPRECSEKELSEKIEAMVPEIENVEQCIFNLHVPPIGSGLDIVPKLKANLEIDPKGSLEVGSTAVLEAIKKYQPILGLHGHVHEVTAERRIGRTLCVNPGSHYTEGILNGVIVTFGDDKIKSTMFTTG